MADLDPRAEADGSSVETEEAPLLDAYDLSFGYGGVPVWEHVDVALYEGDVAYLVGPNGAGKTTLLKCLAGWIGPTAGEIRIAGERMTGTRGDLRRQVAFVADVPAFYDDLTAREHLDFVLRANRVAPERRREADLLLERFGIRDACDAYPSAFSRGMRQKLALAIAFSAHPRILLLDEATGPLDPASRELLGELVRDAAASGTAVLMSCHHELPGVEPAVIYELADGTVREVDDDGL
ncbi:MAG: ABC transporter ATP-binding protein [Collinsella sp.]|nr:ABC transporter ATP-binding protein [Collinsella sp.]